MTPVWSGEVFRLSQVSYPRRLQGANVSCAISTGQKQVLPTLPFKSIDWWPRMN